MDLNEGQAEKAKKEQGTIADVVEAQLRFLSGLGKVYASHVQKTVISSLQAYALSYVFDPEQRKALGKIPSGSGPASTEAKSPDWTMLARQENISVLVKEVVDYSARQSACYAGTTIAMIADNLAIRAISFISNPQKKESMASDYYKVLRPGYFRQINAGMHTMTGPRRQVQI